ncbi:hypothetical protein, partial [Streptomyces sp. NPDC127092]|uniref:hypothetical protein n=1 Tax=Streptomyces sp. NPDC127092 TaxID=3347135 RepID=UPI0036576053
VTFARPGTCVVFGGVISGVHSTEENESRNDPVTLYEAFSEFDQANSPHSALEPLARLPDTD